MKKILSLILSFAMVMAIAAGAVSAEGVQIGFSGNEAVYTQGQTITAQVTGLPVTAAELKGKVDSSEATVTIKAVSGASYIDSYTCLYDTENDVVSVEVKTKNAYQPIVSERITIEFSLKLDGQTYAATFDTDIGWDEFTQENVQSALDNGTILAVAEGPAEKTADNSNPVVITKQTNEAIAAAGEYEGKTLKLGFGSLAQADVKFSLAQTSANFYWDTLANDSVLSSNPDAKLGFFNVRGENSFAEDTQVTIFADPSLYGDNPYLYSISEDGKLTAMQTTVNKGNIQFSTKSLGSYVISDSQLKSAGGSTSSSSTATTENNPFTGDNNTMLIVAGVLLIVCLLLIVISVVFVKVVKKKR